MSAKFYRKRLEEELGRKGWICVHTYPTRVVIDGGDKDDEVIINISFNF